MSIIDFRNWTALHGWHSLRRTTDLYRKSIFLILCHRQSAPETNARKGTPQLGDCLDLRLGIYYSIAKTKTGLEISKLIHSKLLLIDDRFLTVGSANAANRSLGLDTELNVSWEASSGSHGELVRSIQHLRIDLLAEHTGVDLERAMDLFSPTQGLIERLDHLADSQISLLRHHGMATRFSWLKILKKDGVGIDPVKPFLEEKLHRFLLTTKRAFSSSQASPLQRIFFSLFHRVSWMRKLIPTS